VLRNSHEYLSRCSAQPCAEAETLARRVFVQILYRQPALQAPAPPHAPGAPGDPRR
jgi:hypothetical protein